MAQIRPYAAQDKDWLVDRHAALYAAAEGFDDTFGPLVGRILDEFAASHDPSCEAGWIAQENGRRLGSIFCVRHGPDRAKLRLFLLVPGARGKGLGQALLTQCMTFAQRSGYQGMTLWTHASHEAACALYVKNGWRLTRSEPVRSFGVDLEEQTFEIAF